MTKIRPPALAPFAARPFRPQATTAGLSLGLLLLGACGGASQGALDPGADDGGSGGTGAVGAGSGGTSSGSGGVSGSGGTIALGGSAGTVVEAGASGSAGMPAFPPLFEDQVVDNAAPARRTLYSWTVPEQIEALRRDRVVLTTAEQQGKGRGYAFTLLDSFAAGGTLPEHELMTVLSASFEKIRYAWPHPWATRMGWPGEDYGSELVRMVLKPEAWLAHFYEDGTFGVYDLENRPVPIEDALATPERIAAIYFVKTTFVDYGSFSECSGGYREFIVGNEAMIEEWSVGTEEMRAVLVADAERMEALLSRIRETPIDAYGARFSMDVPCLWLHPPPEMPSEADAYLHALALPSPYYQPTPANIAAIAETLRASLFEPNPLVVSAESP
jgi:hypothetical protein